MSKRTQKTNSMNLFSTIRLRDLTLKNRIVVSPMQQYSATEGIPGDWHLVHLGSRAIGGAGLLLTECTAVPPQGMATLSDVGIWNVVQQKSWKAIVDFVHLQGAKIGIQLWHAGGKGSLKHPKEGMLPLGVSEGGWQLKSSSATMINEPVQANAIITDGLADLILIAREHLRDPYFSLHAAKILGEEIAIPWQYQRAF